MIQSDSIRNNDSNYKHEQAQKTKIYTRHDHPKEKSFEDIFGPSQTFTWIDNTFNQDLVDKVNLSVETCVDKVASSTQASFCNSLFTDLSIEAAASTSKSASYGINSSVVTSLNLVMKSICDLNRLDMETTYKLHQYFDSL